MGSKTKLKQNLDSQRTDWWLPEEKGLVVGDNIGKGDEVQRYSYKSSHRDIMYSTGNIVNNTALTSLHNSN